MPRPPTDLAPDARLRHELAALLRGGQAFVEPRTVLRGVPPEAINRRVEGFPHSLWDLIEHLRFSQADILEFARSTDYATKSWPDDYWPDWDASPIEWDAACANFLADLDALVALVQTGDLTAEFEHAPGYTLLRQILVAAEHNAHHLGQVVALRRQLGLWPPREAIEG